MTYIAVTDLNNATWDKFGLNWLRQAKSAKLKGFVINDGLSGEAVKKINELGFGAVPLVGSRYQTLVENLERGQRCLLTRPETIPKSNLLEDKDVNCIKGSFSEFDIVLPIRNLSNRVEAIRSLRKMPALASTSAILGTWDFWVGFLGFSKYMGESYMEQRPMYDEAMLNLFLATSGSFSLEFSHG